LALASLVPPIVPSDPLTLVTAQAGEAYVSTVATNAWGSDLTFAKVGGPGWLVVEPDGRVSGTPRAADAGNSRFRVRVASASSPAVARDFEVIVPVATPADWLTLYEFHGAANDSLGALHAGEFGSPGYVPGWFDQAVRFDGVDDYIQVPAGVLDGVTAVTFAVRFRWNGGSSWQRIFDFGNSNTQYLMLTPSSSVGTLRFSITLGGSAAQQFIQTDAPPIGEWTHIAVTLDGSEGRIYVNGELAASGSISITPADIAPTFNYLGKSQWPDPALRGAIDDFRMIGRALNPAEIRALAVPSAGSLVPRLQGYAAWATGIVFPSGREGPDADADGDGIPNAYEWLFGTDPLDAASGAHPQASLVSAGVLGFAEEETFLTLTARVRKERPGVTLIAEGAPALGMLGSTLADGLVAQAGSPIDDGDFEILTWFYQHPVEDADRGFMRLRVELSEEG
jgi:hypothetical protein